MSSKANGPPRSSPDRAADVELRKRATEKLGPGDWMVTRRSLQQATAWQVARVKASWLGSQLVYDLCCGIGGDAIELARRGPVTAVDSDPDIAALVKTNLAQVSESRATQVICTDVTSINIPDGASIHIDPDRRNDQSRTVQPDRYRPPWDDVCRIVSGADAAVIKLAPAADFDPKSMGDVHRCWISLRRTVREQSVLIGNAIDNAGLEPGNRSAVAIRLDGTTAWFRPQSNNNRTVDSTSEPSTFLVDPDPAVRAAGLTESFACENDLRLLHQPSGFLTGDVLTPALTEVAIANEVVWFGACDDRKLRREFRARNVFPQTIKVRGTGHDPALLTKRYRKCGQHPVTLWIGRAGHRVFAAITK